MKIYANFKMHDKDGRRLCIFAQRLNDETMITTVWKVSKQDNLNKKLAWEMYRYLDHFGFSGLKGKYGITSITERVIKIDKDKPTKSFLDWCYAKFYMEYTEYYTKPKYVRYGTEEDIFGFEKIKEI